MMGLEGVVSKRIDAPYRSGPSKVWLKSKNPTVKYSVAGQGTKDGLLVRGTYHLSTCEVPFTATA